MKTKLKNYTLLFALMLLATSPVFSQITTAGMTGTVETESGERLPGATVLAVHEPSGSQYGTITNKEGLFDLQGMRSGGPYRVEVSFVGYNKGTFTDIRLFLGETYILNATMKESSVDVGEVVVLGTQASPFRTTKTGATTNISNEQMNAMPTINRSISDIARISPYANGMSFAGGDGRSTNFTVDGANFNNNFGLGSNLPGGGNPISMDAIEEVQVVIAPFDVRQTNFIGGGINAITKSGTNTFKGTGYTYYRNQDMRGNKIGDKYFGERAEESKTTYGASLGGPIIENKLFFFGNIEKEKSPEQVVNWKPSTDGVTDEQTISRTTISDLQAVSDHLKNKYGYDTGSFTDFPADQENIKYLLRLDWNINDANKMNIRYNYTKNTAWNAPNGNSTDGAYRDRNKNRISQYSMSYANSMYSMDNLVKSGTIELNSRINEKMSNQVIATYSDIQDVRGTNSSVFPFIDIMSGDIASGAEALDPYISAGYELFTYNNGVKNKIYTITDNFTYYLDAHKLTAGISYEHQSAANSYMRSGTGYYRYASLSDFLNGAAPVDFALTYGANGEKNPVNEVVFSQLGFYAQDEWTVKPNLKLTFGLRADRISFLNDIMRNQAIYDLDFGGRKIDTGAWPDAKINLSPRIGANWDVKGDKSLVIRGGSGLFTGRLPLVFFTNMPSNAGMNQLLMKVQTRFNPDGSVKSRDANLDKLTGGLLTSVDEMISTLGFQTEVTPEDGSVVSSVAGVDPDFKMPQVWKTAAGVDFQVPVSFPLSVTAEGVFTKNVNAVMQENYLVKTPTDSWETFSGPDNRYIYSDYLYSPSEEGVRDACVLTNTSKGYGYTLNLTVNAEPIEDLKLMLAYTRTEMKEVSGMPGSYANSAWSGVTSVNGPNVAEAQRSQYVIPDKVVGALNYRFGHSESKIMRGTTISVFYSGYSPYGNSFTYSNDMNSDGVNADLIYIPKAKGDIQFVSPEDENAFFAFIEQDDYLSKHKGEYAEANAARAPWVHKFDLRILEDLSIKVGKTTHTIQLSADVLNVGNLINSEWGVNKNMAASNYGSILKYESRDANYVPTFSMVKVGGEYPTKTYSTYENYNQCWQLQVGVRYFF
ncbi:TonB-dependent receptor [uncultured Sunxiuqinia sp.]|uniref:TonB-dependent receptor n=1 Tax=uncultured Sunxiuqinia sp. TaxID=1573825 RepID=UPI002625C91B|nr:TonB-dependent receptor [uncultured Sunxiuqinia sp.]